MINQRIPRFYDIVIDFNNDEEKIITEIVGTINEKDEINKGLLHGIVWDTYFGGFIFKQIGKTMSTEKIERY